MSSCRYPPEESYSLKRAGDWEENEGRGREKETRRGGEVEAESKTVDSSA